MKIICIGRNYVNHVKELGNDLPTEPLFFLKPDTSIQPKGHPFFYTILFRRHSLRNRVGCKDK